MFIGNRISIIYGMLLHATSRFFFVSFRQISAYTDIEPPRDGGIHDI